MIYLDHAATSWPKPPEVLGAMVDFLERAGGNPGRSGHRLSIEAARIVYGAREALAELFGAPNPLRLILTENATHAINLALRGLLRPGDRVVVSSMEHNAVMRPLRALEREGVIISVAPCASDGSLAPADLAAAVVPGTKLVALTHGSNVTGTLLPVAEAAGIAHAVGALLMVDAAQTAGVVPIHVRDLDVDLLAFTGHKGLQGPPGTGGLVLGQRVDAALLQPLVRGGTGSHSEFEEQPHALPDRFESGTPNGAGIAGLGASVRTLQERGIADVRAHEMETARLLYDGLASIRHARVFGPPQPERRTATVSFTIDGMRVSEVGLRLDEEFEVLCRVGLHCAPAAHRTIGTFPEGTVRFAAGISNTRQQIETALRAVERIAHR